MTTSLMLLVAALLAIIGISTMWWAYEHQFNGRTAPTPVRTLWAGIRKTDVLCHSVGAADTVAHLHDGGQINISDHLVIRALTRNGVLHGYGMVIAQSSDPNATFDHDRHRQYFWLVEGWMMGAGIGPRSYILMYDDELDPVPDAPEQWK